MAAVSGIKDQAVLAKLALEEKDGYVRAAEVGKLTDQQTLARVSAEDKDPRVREAAIGGLTDQAALATVAFRDPLPLLRLDAIQKLTDQGLLTEIVLHNPPASGAAQDAINRLDANHLAVIEGGSVNPAVVLAARVRLNETTWDEALAQRDLSPLRGLQVVLVATHLVKSPQPLPVLFHASVIHYFGEKTLARSGLGPHGKALPPVDPAWIPALCLILDRFGDEYMATQYVNADEPELQKAGNNWANAHGYSVEYNHAGGQR